MTNAKNTRKALLLSAVSLLLCFAMLLGTTFAWFTDSASSGSNVITSGNLDIVVKYTLDGTTWNDLDGAQDLFKKGLWEPGHTEVVALKVVNNGNLALTYTAKMNIISEKVGTNKDGGNIKLSELLVVNTAEVEESALAPAVASDSEIAGTTAKAFKDSGILADSAKLLKTGETDYIIIKVDMPETVGNEANAKDADSTPAINFGLTFMASQYTYETDSFDDQYDKDAGGLLEKTPVSSFEELTNALAAKMEKIVLTADVSVPEGLIVDYDVTIDGAGKAIVRDASYTGAVITVKNGVTFTAENVTIDGGAVWASSMATEATVTNSGIVATGDLIVAEANAKIVLNEGAVLQNNDGAFAVNLGTRIGATLTLNGGEILYNRSSAGAVWGGGHITINSGKINNNMSTGSAGAIRMVSNCNLTMNGGEICNNTAPASGGAIWGYGASVYNLNGGKMSGNTAAAGGAIYTGDGSTINISGTFELTNNTATEVGALRLSNRTVFNMTGGKVSGNVSTNAPKWNGFYGWNSAVNISGGELADDIYIQGGLTPNVGGDGITGVVHFDVSTTHNTVNLKKDFGTIKFTVAEGSNFAAFNFAPAADYVYTEGDEAKLVCLNEGYSTYWNAEKGVFNVKAD